MSLAPAPCAAALLVVALLMVMAVPPTADAAAPPLPTPPELGYLHRGALYAVHVPERYPKRGVIRKLPRRTEVWRARLTSAGLAGKRKYSWRLPAWKGALVRWRIHDGHLWWTAEGVEASRIARVPLIRLFGPEQADGTSEPYTWHIGPLVELTDDNQLTGGMPPTFATWNAHFDFLPTGRRRMRLVVAWRGELRLWRATLHPNPDDDANWFKWDGEIKTVPKETEPGQERAPVWSYPPTWRARTAVREPFHAFQDRTHVYLVTASGMLYGCPQRGGPTELLWGDRGRPIRAIVSDADTGRTFAFTGAGGAGAKGGAVYFELAPKPRPVPYDLKRVAARKEGDPLASLAGYAVALLKDKKVKPAE